MKKETAEELLQLIVAEFGKDEALRMINKADSGGDKEQQMDDFIKGLCAKLTIKTSADYPNYIFYMDGDTLIMEHDKKNGYLWLSYKNIWRVFEEQFGLNYNGTQSVTKSLLEKHLKLKGVTTSQIISIFTE